MALHCKSMSPFRRPDHCHFCDHSHCHISRTPFLTAYPCEIWPFHLRSRGLTVTWVATICAIFFNTFVNPIALAEIKWKYYTVFIVMLLAFGLTAFFFYPETKGFTLEEIAVLFDRPEMQLSNSEPSATTEDNIKLGTSATHDETV